MKQGGMHANVMPGKAATKLQNGPQLRPRDLPICHKRVDVKYCFVVIVYPFCLCPFVLMF